jgi:hypothetical protein
MIYFIEEDTYMENKVIMLDEESRNALERFSKQRGQSEQLIKRARVVLHLDRKNKKDHLRITRISESLGISRQAIYDIRDDFLAAKSVEGFLTRKKRETPPVPAKVTGEVEARIIALACSKPPKGYARWSLRLLADYSVRMDIVDSVSDMTIHRLLKKRNLSLT